MPLPEGGFKIAAPAQLEVYQILASDERTVRSVVLESDLLAWTGSTETSAGPERGDGRAETTDVNKRQQMENFIL